MYLNNSEKRYLQLAPRILFTGGLGYYLIKILFKAKTSNKVVDPIESGPIKLDKNVLKVFINLIIGWSRS